MPSPADQPEAPDGGSGMDVSAEDGSRRRGGVGVAGAMGVAIVALAAAIGLCAVGYLLRGSDEGIVVEKKTEYVTCRPGNGKYGPGECTTRSTVDQRPPGNSHRQQLTYRVVA